MADVADAGNAFKQAFDQFDKIEDGADTTPIPDAPLVEPAPVAEVPPAEPVPVETPPAEVPPVETPPAGTPPAETPPAETLPAETPPAGTPPAETPPAEPSSAAADEVLNRLAGLLNKTPDATAQPEPAPQEEAPLYTADEIASIQNFEKDWPDVAKAVTLRSRADYRDLVKMIYENVQQYVEPLFQLGDQLAARQHQTDLAAKVPDYQTITPQEMTAWIEQQPSYLQAPMKQVMQAGTADEVAHLIGSYRAASRPATPVLTPTPPASKAELSDDAKQAARSLAPVSSDRTVVPAEDDPGDFRTAFDKFSAEQDS